VWQRIILPNGASLRIDNQGTLLTERHHLAMRRRF